MKESFTYCKPDTLVNITYWLNTLVGSQWTSGTVVRVIDWQICHTGRYAEYHAVARVEVK
jgi:hypothetical protein